MIARILQNIIQDELKTFNKAIVILGSRQVGKTTLLQQIVKEKKDVLYFNADEPNVRTLFSNVGKQLLSRLFGAAKYIVIDEAQRVENIGLTLKIITDQMPDVQLFVSGSSSLDLANKINEPLTGRKLEHRLYPVSFKEMVEHTNLWEEKEKLETRLLYGYYPEIVTYPGKEITLLQNLTGSYLYQDILSFGLIKKPIILDKLLKALALQIGQEVKYNELAQTVGADKETVERYIDLLEKVFIVFRLPALNRNVRNEIKKGKKIYFYDTGIRNAIIGDFNNFKSRPDSGALWENFIISERVKYLDYNGFYGRYYFWRTTQQQEIDFIEEQDGQFSLYEFKLNPKRKHSFSKTFLNKYPVKQHQIITPENIEDFLFQP